MIPKAHLEELYLLELCVPLQVLDLVVEGQVGHGGVQTLPRLGTHPHHLQPSPKDSTLSGTWRTPAPPSTQQRWARVPELLAFPRARVPRFCLCVPALPRSKFCFRAPQLKNIHVPKT